jgi:hypothetical protein
MTDHNPPPIKTPPPSQPHRFRKPTFMPGLIDHSKPVVAGLPFFRTNLNSSGPSSSGRATSNAPGFDSSPSSSTNSRAVRSASSGRSSLTPEAIRHRNTVFRGWVTRSSPTRVRRSHSVPNLTTISPLRHPTLTDPQDCDIPTIRDMYYTIESLSTITEIRNALNEFIKEILTQLLGPPPQKTGFQCLRDGHHYSEIMLVSGVTKGLLSNLGYYAHKVRVCFVRYFPLTLILFGSVLYQVVFT